MAANVNLPEGFVLDQPQGLPEGFVLDQPEQPNKGIDTQGVKEFAGGAGQSLLQGATLGFSDEIQSVIAAAVAAPFIEDKTFGQLMVDARKSLRKDNEEFKAKNPKTALALEVAGGAVTGGAGLAKNAAAKTLGQAALQSTKTGAALGTAAGAGFSDQEEFLSQGTAEDALTGTATGALVGGVTPAAIKGVVNAGKVIPKEVPEKLLQTALKFRPSISTEARTKMTQTALREGILPTVSGLEKITKKIEGLDRNLNKIIDNATEKGTLISKKVLFSQLKSLRQNVGGTKLDAGSDLKHIEAVAKSFDEHLKSIKKGKLTPRELQDLKTDAYKRINFDLKQGKASFAKNEARKTIARSAKESLEGVDGDIKGINQRMGDLLELREELEGVVGRLDNRNIISLDTAAKIGAGGATGTPEGVAAGATASFFGAPRVKAKAAMLLENVRRLSEQKGAINSTLSPEAAAPLMVFTNRIEDALKTEVNEINDQ